ncbi:DEKNAAC103982 [Brettanomyces naardenensis]|uniref:DEKNAAC103982 n=1 Tax=Brettanomyces naardenensis TaxID=13370 RepID=A0A448YPU6_BRENA|nr:DEKNAAC103982 [Brettanomyces naardenensis]
MNSSSYNLEHSKVQEQVVEVVAELSGDSTQVLRLIQKQLFLESLFIDGNRPKSLRILRSLTADNDDQLAKSLSWLLLAEGKTNADASTLSLLRDLHWDLNCDLESSRQLLLQEILDRLPSNDTPDPNRLVNLIDEALKYQQMVNPYYFPDFKDSKPSESVSFYRDFGRTVTPEKRLLNLPVRLKLKLSLHEDEIWYVRYSNSGRFLASASVDKNIVIYDAENNYTVYKKLTGHKGSIIYLSWSHDDGKLITSSFDQTIKIWDLENDTCTTIRNQTFFNSNLRIWSVEFVGEDNSFVIGSPDKELALFDSEGFAIHDFTPEYRIDDLTVINDEMIFAITHSCELLIFSMKDKDYRLVNTVKIGKKLTAISSSPGDNEHVLINVKPDELQLWNVKDVEKPYLENKYYGLQQSDYIIRGCLSDRNLVLSGSEDGLVYVWNTRFGNLVGSLQGHKSLINCIAWRPNKNGVRDGCEWASCGDDREVNVWGF